MVDNVKSKPSQRKTLWKKISSFLGMAEKESAVDEVLKMPVFSISDQYVLQSGETDIPADTKTQIEKFQMYVGYPPKAKGFPARLSGRQLLAKTQSDMVHQIKKELFMKDGFEKYILPLLVNVADFVHLLPASEHHHHRAQGGLLRHNLEVCYNAIKAMKVIEFDEKENPEQKSLMVFKWRLAVVVTALLHDIGKPVTDYEIWNEEGTLQWNPKGKNIFEWAVENNIDRYYLSWNKNRHNNHKLLASSMIEKIVPYEIIEILQQNSRNVFFKVIDAISTLTPTDAQKRNNALIDLVINADKKSVLEDMKLTSGDAIRSSGTGVSTIQRMVDTMRLLISTNVWKPNVYPSPVWVTTDGVYIFWQKAADNIYERIRELDVFIPQSADSLADIMLTNDLVEEGENGSVYWRVITEKYLIEHDLPTKFIEEPPLFMYSLKLKSPETLFSDLLQPIPTTAYVKKASKWIKYEPTAEQIAEELKNVEEDISNTDSTESTPAPEPEKATEIRVVANSKPNSTIVEESNNNENYITEEVTEEVLVKLLCNVGVLEESKSDPDPELTPILANPPHSVPLTTTTPQNNLNLKVTEFKPVTKKTKSPSLLDLSVTLQNQSARSQSTDRRSLSIGEVLEQTDKQNTNKKSPQKKKNQQPAVVEKVAAPQQLTEHPKTKKIFSFNHENPLDEPIEHSRLYKKTPLKYREIFENEISRMEKEDLLSLINQNHFLYSEKKSFPQEWILDVALMPRKIQSVVLRSETYCILHKNILIDLYVLTKYSEIRYLLFLSEQEKKIRHNDLLKIIQSHSSSDEQTVLVMHNSDINAASGHLNISKKLFLKLIAIHFESFLYNNKLRVNKKYE